MKLQDVLEDFRQFLLSNFEEMSELLSDNLLADWLQANWEIIVESRLQEMQLIPSLLDVYGDGADCNGASSRVSLPDLSPKCSIQVKEGYVLHSFGIIKNSYFV